LQPVTMKEAPLKAFTAPPDGLFGGLLQLHQPARGHRAGTDAVLLAAAAPLGARRIIDLGCGVGTVGLRVAQTQSAIVQLIDKSADILGYCRQNIAGNGLSERAICIEADCLSRDFPAREACLSGWADVVLTNPPFALADAVRASPTPLRAEAHVLAGTLEGWVKAALKCLVPRGQLVMIHRADALPAILTALQGRFGGATVRFVHPRAGEPAHRLLIRATRGSRAPLMVLPPLVLHQADGRFTPEAAALHAGEAVLGWR